METGAIAMLAPKLPSFAVALEGIVTMPNGKPAIAFIGFGEAGQAIAAGLREAGVETMSAWDILFPQAAGEKLKRPPKRRACVAPIRPRTRSAART